MTNLEIIRKACIAANPSILDLKFGCEVKNKKFGYTFFVSFCDKENEVVVYCPKEFDNQFHHDSIEHFEAGKMEILGRPIRLADVLLAIESQKNVTVLIDSLGCFMTVMPGEQPVFISALKAQWNLAQDDLTTQSEETLSFLANLFS